MLPHTRVTLITVNLSTLPSAHKEVLCVVAVPLLPLVPTHPPSVPGISVLSSFCMHPVTWVVPRGWPFPPGAALLRTPMLQHPWVRPSCCVCLHVAVTVTLPDVCVVLCSQGSGVCLAMGHRLAGRITPSMAHDRDFPGMICEMFMPSHQQPSCPGGQCA